MSQPYTIPVYKAAPFLRLLSPFIAGIILQWYNQIPLPVIVLALFGFTAANATFYFLPISLRYKLQALQGFLINVLLLALGLLITWQKDPRHLNAWYGNNYHDSGYIIARIEEPLIEKAKSYKATAVVETLTDNGQA